MPKLTKRTVDALKPQAKAYIAYDSELHGFGVRVMPSRQKSFVVEYRPGGGGRRVATRRLTLGSYGILTPDQARRAAQEALARVRLGGDPQAEKNRERASLTLSGLIETFLADHAGAKRKASTAAWYRDGLERIVKPALGRMSASKVTRRDIVRLHSLLNLTPVQANRVLSMIGALYGFAARAGYVPEGYNPARGIERYPEQARERFLTSEELARLGDTLRLAETGGLPWQGAYESKHTAKEENRCTVLDPFAAAAIRLLILTGARLREILDAQWQHVDFERGILFLPDSKTGRKPVYLSAPAMQVLASLPRLEGNPHIIAGLKDGQPRADLKKPWAAVTKAAGLEGLRLHDLRHSFASIGAGASLGLPIIGKLLGHSQAATTHRYAHLDADPMRRAVDLIGTRIATAMDGRPATDVVPLMRVR